MDVDDDDYELQLALALSMQASNLSRAAAVASAADLYLTSCETYVNISDHKLIRPGALFLVLLCASRAVIFCWEVQTAVLQVQLKHAWIDTAYLLLWCCRRMVQSHRQPLQLGLQQLLLRQQQQHLSQQQQHLLLPVVQVLQVHKHKTWLLHWLLLFRR